MKCVPVHHGIPAVGVNRGYIGTVRIGLYSKYAFFHSLVKIKTLIFKKKPSLIWRGVGGGGKYIPFRSFVRLYRMVCK